MKLSLGTAQFGLHYGIANDIGQVSVAGAREILQIARHHGVEALDTAIGYGSSETCLGELGTSGFKVVTKLPPLPADCIDVNRWVNSQVSSSLDRLNLGSIYGLLLHRPEQLMGPFGRQLAAALMAVKDEGLVRKIGVSIYSPAGLEAMTSACQIDLVQAPFNLIDRRLLTSGWMDRLYLSGVEIHTRSVFLQGLLLMRRDKIPVGFYQWDALWDRWHTWLTDHGVSAVSTCLRFQLLHSQIANFIVGVESAEQLAQLFSAMDAAGLDLEETAFPDLMCDDEFLINPSNWQYLENIQ